MGDIDLNGRAFVLMSNSAGDARPGETSFEVEQTGSLLRIRYGGGSIAFGAMVGHFLSGRSVYVRFQHVTFDREFATGEANLEFLHGDDDRLSVVDTWHSTSTPGKQGHATWSER